MLPVSRTFRVVTYDARGHGRSAKPSSGYGFDTVIADALAVLRATAPPGVHGRSFVGASVALELAARHPRSVRNGPRRRWPRLPPRRDGLGHREGGAAPPRLAGMPVDEFRGSIRMFLGDEVEITPDIALSLMRIDRHGRIRPHLSRANHFRILRAMLRHPDEALARLSVRWPSSRMEGRGRGGHTHVVPRTARRSGAPIRVSWLEGIHDLPLQHPAALAGRIERFSEGLVR